VVDKFFNDHINRRGQQDDRVSTDSMVSRAIDQAANQKRQEPVAAAAHQNKLSTSITISTKW